MSGEKKPKEMRVTTISFEQFGDIDFIPPSTFFYKDAMGVFNFIHTSSRQDAQKYVDDLTGVKGKYSVIASKLQKTVSKLESGGYSCTGVGSRKK